MHPHSIAIRALSAAACAAALVAAPALAQHKEVKIGVIYDYTGPFAAGGSQAAALGTKIAIDMIGGFIAAFIFAQFISVGGFFFHLEWGYVAAFLFFIAFMVKKLVVTSTIRPQRWVSKWSMQARVIFHDPEKFTATKRCHSAGSISRMSTRF